MISLTPVKSNIPLENVTFQTSKVAALIKSSVIGPNNLPVRVVYMDQFTGKATLNFGNKITSELSVKAINSIIKESLISQGYVVGSVKPVKTTVGDCRGETYSEVNSWLVTFN
jgi:hypothetical protein